MGMQLAVISPPNDGEPCKYRCLCMLQFFSTMAGAIIDSIKKDCSGISDACGALHLPSEIITADSEPVAPARFIEESPDGDE